MKKTKGFWAGLLTLATLLSVSVFPVIAAGAPAEDVTPVYSKIFKYNFDYSWVTIGSNLGTAGGDAGADGALNNQNGRWGKSAGPGLVEYDPDDPTNSNKVFKIVQIDHNYYDTMLEKYSRLATGAFVISGRIRFANSNVKGTPSNGQLYIRYGSKTLLTFSAPKATDNFTWTVGDVASGGTVEREKWITYDIYVEPVAGDWADATVTAYISGDVKNATGQTVSQLVTTKTGFDTGHDGATARTFSMFVEYGKNNGGARFAAYVDDTHLYQPGLMSVSTVGSTDAVAANGSVTLRMMSGDTPVGADVAVNRRMGQNLDFSTVSASGISVVPVGGGAAVTPEVSVDPKYPDRITVSFVNTPLAANTTYSLVVDDSVLDVAGRGVDPDENTVTFTTEELYTVTVDVGQHGTVTVDPVSATVGAGQNEEFTIDAGQEVKFTITPNEGYEIDEMTFNGSTLIASGIYTISSLNENAVFTVTFKEKEQEQTPTITIIAPVHVGPQTFNDGNLIVSSSFISYATISNPDGYTVASYGMYLKDVDTGKVIDLPVLYKTADGQFAVQVFGGGFNLGSQYTLRAYVVYLDNEENSQRFESESEESFTWQ